VDDHRQHQENLALWDNLAIGSELTVVKLDPSGAEAARYPGVVVATDADGGWVALHAIWTYRRVEIDKLVFEPGDNLIEWFSPSLPFNAFAVQSPEGTLRGWYANVTYPTYLVTAREDPGELTLVWHDLYLDLVGLPDSSYVVRDEDELAESGLESSNSPLHAEIVAAGEELVRRFVSNQMPFRLPSLPGAPRAARRESQE
jgi:hypothetical protein